MSRNNPWRSFPASPSGWQRTPNWGERRPTPPMMPAKRRGRKQTSPLETFLLWLGIAVFCVFSVISAAGIFSDGDISASSRAQEHYQNESYQVSQANLNPPDLPRPKTYQQAREFMVNNPIYQQQAPSPVRCNISPINTSQASVSQLEQHLNDYTACLMRVFGPAIENAGFTAVRPPVTVYDSPVYTACGKMDEYNAAYCAADQQVYYAKSLPEIFPYEYRRMPFVAESVLAHEFGHAIQGRTGILVSERAYENQLSKREALELSRRTEVQADCWAGQFNSAIQDSIGLADRDQQNLAIFFSTLGDDVLNGDANFEGDHGLGSNRKRWYLTGTKTTEMGACNTFTAPSNTVR